MQRLSSVFQGLHYAYHALSTPVSSACQLSSTKIHPAYGMTALRKQRLGARMMLNNVRIQSGTIYKLHLAMALKLLEMSPDMPGDIVECGTWKGGSAANLSLVAKITGRRLRIYDSSQGPPPANPKDREGYLYDAGDYSGSVEEFYVGPLAERNKHPLQYPGTGAYTQKTGMSGLWTYYENA